MKKLLLSLLTLAALAGCGTSGNRHHAVYLLVDTSGTYTRELGKAEQLMAYLLGELHEGDSIAVARVKSRSFTEKDILAKTTLDNDPLKANTQKKAFQQEFRRLTQANLQGSAYTDITGGLLLASEFLRETGAGRKTVVIFSDMQEELDKQTVRDLPIDLKGIRVVAVNVTKLDTDNMDPRRYLDRMARWEERVRKAGASDWQVINDLSRPERILAARR